MTNRPCRTLQAGGAVAAVIIALWGWKVLVAPRPYWAFVNDVEMTYLAGSRALAAGWRQFESPHPGTPVHFAGAVIMRAAGMRLPDAPRVLAIGYVLGLAATVAGLFVVAQAAGSRLTAPLGAAAAALGVLHPSALVFLTYWSPELFLLPLGWAVLAAVWRGVDARGTAAARWLGFAGGLAGYACGLKVIALPLVLAVLAAGLARPAAESSSDPVVRRLGGRCVLALAGLLAAAWGLLRCRPQLGSPMVSGVLMGLALLAAGSGVWLLSPLSRRAPRIGQALSLAAVASAGAVLGWLVATPIVFGTYPWFLEQMLNPLTGRTAVAGPGLGWSAKLTGLLQRAPLATMWIAAVGFGLAWACGRLWRSRDRAPHASALAMGVACAVALAGSVAQGVLLTPFTDDGTAPGTSLRYFLPVACALPFAFAWWAGQWQRHRPDAARRLAPALGVLVACSVGLGIARDLREHRQLIAARQAEQAAVDALLAQSAAELGRPPVALLWEIYRPAFALRWGAYRYTWGPARAMLQREVDTRFPNEQLFPLREWRTAVLPAQWDLALIRVSELPAEHTPAREAFEAFLKQWGTVQRTLLTAGVDAIVVQRKHRSGHS